jgi:hypothetical protein
MASYPSSIYSPREKENRSGVTYDPDKKTVIFAEDIKKVDDEIVAIETELGTNPRGTFNSVKDFLQYLLGKVKDYFTDLLDVPHSYQGQAGKVLKVKQTEDGLEFGEAPAGKWVVVAEVNVGANCDYVDFTGLDINTDKQYILFVVLKNPQTSNSDYWLYVEGNYTNTNYYSQYIYGSGTTLNVGRITGAYIATAPAGDRTRATAWINRDADGYPRWNVMECRSPGSTVAIQQLAVTKTATVTNITSIRISASVAGGIGTGSYLLLCKARG